MNEFGADTKYVEQVLAMYSDPYDLAWGRKYLPHVLALYSDEFKANIFKYGDIGLSRFVILTQDVYRVNGQLRAERGAKGIIVGDSLLGGCKDVLFDDGPEFIELSGCGQRLTEVPSLALTVCIFDLGVIARQGERQV